MINEDPTLQHVSSYVILCVEEHRAHDAGSLGQFLKTLSP